MKELLVWISVRSCLLKLGVLRANNNHWKAVLSLVVMFIESQRGSWGRTVESHCWRFWEQGWPKPGTALQGWVPCWQEDGWEALRASSVCSSMILIREIDADSLQVVCPWLSCHVTAYGSKPVSQGMKSRWKEEESPPEVLTSSQLFLSKQGQLQTTGTQEKERQWQKELLVTFLQGQQGCKPLSTPRVVWKKSLVWVNGLLWARSVHPMW